MKPNLLLIGPDAVVGDYLDRLIPSVTSPVQFWDGAAPDFTHSRMCSLIVRDVDRLDRADQERLIEWLNRHGEDGRVIATSRGPVFPHVERGEFSDALYYRINTVTLVLGEGTEMRWIGHLPPSTNAAEGAPQAF